MSFLASLFACQMDSFSVFEPCLDLDVALRRMSVDHAQSVHLLSEPRRPVDKPSIGSTMAGTPKKKRRLSVAQSGGGDTEIDISAMLRRPCLTEREVDVATNPRALLALWWKEIEEIRSEVRDGGCLLFGGQEGAWAHACHVPSLAEGLAGPHKKYQAAFVLSDFADPSTFDKELIDSESWPSIESMYKQFFTSPRHPPIPLNCRLKVGVTALQGQTKLPTGVLQVVGSPNLFAALVLGIYMSGSEDRSSWVQVMRCMSVTVHADQDAASQLKDNFVASCDIENLGENCKMNGIDMVDNALAMQDALGVANGKAPTQEGLAKHYGNLQAEGLQINNQFTLKRFIGVCIRSGTVTGDAQARVALRRMEVRHPGNGFTKSPYKIETVCIGVPQNLKPWQAEVISFLDFMLMRRMVRDEHLSVKGLIGKAGKEAHGEVQCAYVQQIVCVLILREHWSNKFSTHMKPTLKSVFSSVTNYEKSFPSEKMQELSQFYGSQLEVEETSWMNSLDGPNGLLKELFRDLYEGALTEEAKLSFKKAGVLEASALLTNSQVLQDRENVVVKAIDQAKAQALVSGEVADAPQASSHDGGNSHDHTVDGEMREEDPEIVKRREAESKAHARISERISFIHASSNISTLELMTKITNHPLWETFSGRWGSSHCVIFTDPAAGPGRNTYKDYKETPDKKSLDGVLKARVEAMMKLVSVKDAVVGVLPDGFKEENREWLDGLVNNALPNNDVKDLHRRDLCCWMAPNQRRSKERGAFSADDVEQVSLHCRNDFFLVPKRKRSDAFGGRFTSSRQYTNMRLRSVRTVPSMDRETKLMLWAPKKSDVTPITPSSKEFSKLPSRVRGKNPPSWWLRDTAFSKCLLCDDLQGQFFIEMMPTFGLLGEVSFEYTGSEILPVLMVCTGPKHEEYIRQHLQAFVLKLMATPGHKMHIESLAEDVRSLFPSLFAPVDEEQSADESEDHNE